MDKNKPIEGIKLIKHNMGGVNNPDDPSYPFRLHLICRVPGFMEVAASFIFSRDEIIVRGKTIEALEKLAELNRFSTHPRLISLEITQPELSAPEVPEPVKLPKPVKQAKPCNDLDIRGWDYESIRESDG